MDEETVTVILQLMQQDVAELMSAQKGKQKERNFTDGELALHTFEEEIHVARNFVIDRRLCRSISRAVQDDGPALTIARAEELSSQEDRRMALALAGQPEGHARPAPPPYPLTEDLLRRLYSLNIGDEDDDTSLVCGSESHHSVDGDSLRDTGEPSRTSRNSRQCVACLEWKTSTESIAAPCSHDYCHSCLRTLFDGALIDESLFPPRCCKQEFALSAVSKLLGPNLVQEIAEKSIEFNTVNRTYCSKQECSAFISPELLLGRDAICSRCSYQTYTLRKRASHIRTCEASLDATVLRAAQDAGWQRCYRCKTVVELTWGCNHITCRCRAEFCYLCGKLWKTCQCPRWDEDRLFDRAAQIIDREPRLDAALPAPRRELRIHQMAQELRERHECDHEGKWRRLEGARRYRCEDCGDRFYKFILECRHCHLRACQTCRCNRR